MKILIIEDEKLLADSLKACLKRKALKPRRCLTAKQALSMPKQVSMTC